MATPSDSGKPKPGPAQLGKYTLVREVGRGGMGVVYEAMDTQVQRKVALKLMLLRPQVEPEQDRQRFEREAQMAAKLKHPNIVTLYEAGELQGRRYLAMEFIEGVGLSAWWKQKGLSLHQKVAVLRDVAQAVHHAHELGVLHRDLKPANILVGAKSRPYVMDFGLAKGMGANTNLSLTGEGLVVGTPAYMSPEQARGLKTVDGRTDVYSIGVMLYELLAGRQPFEGETAIDILMKASKERPQLPSSTSIRAPDPAMDRAIESICLKALEKEPKNRYPTAQALAQDLDRWIEGKPVNISSISTKRRIAAPRKSTAWIYAAVGGAVALALLAFFLLGSSAGVEAELARARRCMEDRRYGEARIEYGKALAKDPSNVEAAEGDRKARLAEEQERKALARDSEEKKDQFRKQLEAAQAQSVKANETAEQKIKAAAEAATGAEQKRLMEELAAIKERARLAEEEAQKARERLRALEAKGEAPPAPAPTPAPRPDPVPAAKVLPPPPPKPAEKAPAMFKDAKAALVALKEAVDAAVDKLDTAALFAAVDAMAAEAGVDPDVTKADALKKAKKMVKTREDGGLLAAAHYRLAEDALANDNFKVALQASKDAGSIAKQAGDAAAADEAATLGKDIQALQPEGERFAKAQRALAASPADAAASFDAGRYLCLVKGRWDDGIPLLARGSDETFRKLGTQEAARPEDPAERKALADGWWAVAQKEKLKAFRNGGLIRAFSWYELALPGLKGAEKVDAEQRMDACLRQAPIKTRVSFVAEKSMKLFPVGHRQGIFPEQKSDDPTAPFRGEPIYYDQRSGTDVVFEIRSGLKLKKLSWKGAAMQNMTIEVLDPAGTVLAKGGPWGGGNIWADFSLDFPPSSRFTLRLSNHISTWYFISKIELH